MYFHLKCTSTFHLIKSYLKPILRLFKKRIHAAFASYRCCVTNASSSLQSRSFTFALKLARRTPRNCCKGTENSLTFANGTASLRFRLVPCITNIIIQQIVTMPIYGKEALNICHPTDTAAKRLRMRSLRPFAVSSLCCSFSFGVLSNCPGTEFAGMALKSSKRRKIHPRVFPFSKKKKNLKLVISRRCFAEDGKEMYQNV